MNSSRGPGTKTPMWLVWVLLAGSFALIVSASGDSVGTTLTGLTGFSLIGLIVIVAARARTVGALVMASLLTLAVASVTLMSTGNSRADAIPLALGIAVLAASAAAWLRRYAGPPGQRRQ